MGSVPVQNRYSRAATGRAAPWKGTTHTEGEHHDHTRQPRRRGARGHTSAGELITPDHPSYDAARQVWNGEIQRRPALIARCRGAADVAAAIRFAREQRPARLRARRRPRGRRARGRRRRPRHRPVGDDRHPRRPGRPHDPGARAARLNADVDRESQAFGLAATGGFVSHTGVAGLTLGGGIGHLMRKFGPGDRRAAVVRRRHRRRRARDAPAPRRTPTSSGGCAAGGGNFGVVTELHLRPAAARADDPRRPDRVAGRRRRRPCSRSCATSSPMRPTRSG